MDFSLPGSSTHGIFQARVLEWGAIAFCDQCVYTLSTPVFIHLSEQTAGALKTELCLGVLSGTGVKTAPTSLLRPLQLPYNSTLNTCRSLGIYRICKLKLRWKITLPSSIMISLLMIMAVVCLRARQNFQHLQCSDRNMCFLLWDGMDSKVHIVHASPSPFLSLPVQTWKSYQLISGNQKNVRYLFCL